jgi:hypothetical protein
MPSLEQLSKNLATFKYYGGYGTFNSNDLPYGHDQVGGGSSNQPFIVRKPGERWSPSNVDVAGIVTKTTRTAADLLRIGKFMTTTVQGASFLATQTGLQMMNPDIQHDGNMLKTNKSQVKNGLFTNIANTISNAANRISNTYGPTRIYNPLGINTLAEVGVVGLGKHYMKHGLTPQYSDATSYEKFIVGKDKEGSNRLEQTLNLISNPGFETSGFPMFQYKGGSDSFLGIGETKILKVRDYGRQDSMILKSDERSGFTYMPTAYLAQMPGKMTNGVVMPYLNDNYTSGTYKFGEFQDFRAVKNDINAKTNAGGIILQSSDFNKKNIQRRIGVSRALYDNERMALKGGYTDAKILADSVDKVNMVSLYYNDTPSDGAYNLMDVNARDFNESDIRDLIKFRIKALDNDSVNGGVYMIFRAYINSIKRGVQSKWNPYNYVGRGESFYTYDGFTESITLQFTIAASSRLEMKPLYQKLNYLISTMTPDYSNNRMRGNIMELTIGDFVKYQPGIITNLDMVMDEETQWEIAIDEPENGVESNMHELPMSIKCNMTFIPIYNFLPRKSSESPFIGIDDLEGSKKNWMHNTDAALGAAKEMVGDNHRAANSHNNRIGEDTSVVHRDVTTVFKTGQVNNPIPIGNGLANLIPKS